MPYWTCCNSCFHSPSAGRKLAITTCGHVICSVCFQKGTQGKCLICKAKCQISPLSDKSSSEVKALFSDINVVATKHFSEIGKITKFQARHQNRLLTHYKQRNEKLEEVLAKVKQEMQQMTKKLNEQSAYIAKLENSLQHYSAKVSSGSQMSHGSQTPQRHKPARQIPYNTPMSLSRHSSIVNVSENMEVDGLFRKPNTVPRLSLISPPNDGRMGTICHRSTDQTTMTNNSACSATVSRFQGASMTPDISYSQSSSWKSPILRPPSSFRHSMSSLVFPAP
ncbi:probable E3 SUMO-protein ligase RNF212 [Notolabrus celidotus]|uniref:probable E3 SUMO-protein ligase RNF212 n=1 Tax=Notolabrus celidotus TaxID=1203425 RepID=UPI00148F93B6|nr:probable E3 SUMO-protein ligase RNF212 [Notolabrus celidotus]XP_034546512.1 probable E3 SUMO-protein ligase RNF212 [Notolabrus celidotus]